MKYLMSVAAVASFGFAGWVASTSVVSDIQLILVALGVIGGLILVGLAALLAQTEGR